MRPIRGLASLILVDVRWRPDRWHGHRLICLGWPESLRCDHLVGLPVLPWRVSRPAAVRCCRDDQLPGGIFAIDCQRVTIRGVHALDTGFVGIWLHDGSHYEIDDCLLHSCGWESKAYSSGRCRSGASATPSAIALDWRVPGGERQVVPEGALFRFDPNGTVHTRRVGIDISGAGPWQLLVDEDESIDAADGERVESAGHDPARDLLLCFGNASGGLSADG